MGLDRPVDAWTYGGVDPDVGFGTSGAWKGDDTLDSHDGCAAGVARGGKSEF